LLVLNSFANQEPPYPQSLCTLVLLDPWNRNCRQSHVIRIYDLTVSVNLHFSVAIFILRDWLSPFSAWSLCSSTYILARVDLRSSAPSGAPIPLHLDNHPCWEISLCPSIDLEFSHESRISLSSLFHSYQVSIALQLLVNIFKSSSLSPVDSRLSCQSLQLCTSIIHSLSISLVSCS
jgi:hypothetical protein